jgi:hypothetical protein
VRAARAARAAPALRGSLFCLRRNRAGPRRNRAGPRRNRPCFRRNRTVDIEEAKSDDLTVQFTLRPSNAGTTRRRAAHFDFVLEGWIDGLFEHSAESPAAHIEGPASRFDLRAPNHHPLGKLNPRPTALPALTVRRTRARGPIGRRHVRNARTPTLSRTPPTRADSALTRWPLHSPPHASSRALNSSHRCSRPKATQALVAAASAASAALCEAAAAQNCAQLLEFSP